MKSATILFYQGSQTSTKPTTKQCPQLTLHQGLVQHPIKKKGLVLHAAHLASYKNINSDDSSTSSPSYHSSTLLLLRSLVFCNGTLTAIMQ